MTDQVLLDEFKELIETITVAVMQDIIKNQMSEEMIREVIRRQAQQSIKAFEEELPKQVDRVTQTIQSEVSCNHMALISKTEQIIEEAAERFEREIPKQVRAQVTEIIKSEINFTYLELSSRIEKCQKSILGNMDEKVKMTLSALQDVQEGQKMQQQSLQEQENKIEVVHKAVKDINAFMKNYETVRKEERKQDLAQSEQQNINWEKKFKILMWTQGITFLVLVGSLVYMVSR